jgi:hypothetical protein
MRATNKLLCKFIETLHAAFAVLAGVYRIWVFAREQCALKTHTPTALLEMSEGTGSRTAGNVLGQLNAKSVHFCHLGKPHAHTPTPSSYRGRLFGLYRVVRCERKSPSLEGKGQNDGPDVSLLPSYWPKFAGGL